MPEDPAGQTILIRMDAQAMPEDTVSRLQQVAPGCRVVISTDPDVIQSVSDDVTIAAGYRPNDLLPRLPRLRWFQQFSSGSDWLQQHPELQHDGYVLTNASGVHPVQITEHVFGVMLALGHHLDESIQAQTRRAWVRHDYGGVVELEGKTLLVVGLGAIGERIAKVARAFGMRVIALRRDTDRSSPHVDHLAGAGDLASLLPDADFVVLAVPLTAQTHHLIGPTEFELMKRDAFLVNIGRGGTVDEQALAAALHRGDIAGAALDVFETEPLPADSPLWSAPNMLITAHNAGASPRYYHRALDIMVDNLERFLAGRPLRNVVDKKAGY